MNKPKRQGKIEIEQELCKSCGFCIEYCPRNCMERETFYNQRGYYPVRYEQEQCNGCAICAVVCPEAIIEVWREERASAG